MRDHRIWKRGRRARYKWTHSLQAIFRSTDSSRLTSTLSGWDHTLRGTRSITLSELTTIWYQNYLRSTGCVRGGIVIVIGNFTIIPTKRGPNLLSGQNLAMFCSILRHKRVRRWHRVEPRMKIRAISRGSDTRRAPTKTTRFRFCDHQTLSRTLSRKACRPPLPLASTWKGVDV